MITPTFAQPSENPFSWHFGDTQFAIQQLFIQVLNPTAEIERSVKQLIRYLKGTQHTCLRLEPRGMVQKRFAGRSLVVVSRIGPTIRQRAKALRDFIAMCRA